MKTLRRLKTHGCLALLAAFTSLVMPAAAADPTFRAGAVAIDITPTKLPVIIAGSFLENTGTKVNDPLFARCLVLDDGKTKIAFVIVDTCMMTQQLIDEAKQRASTRCGIPVDHMMVSATHTHSAPAAMGCLGTRVDKDYAAWLPGKIAEGIAEAAKKLQPAKIGWASIDDWEHTHSRRWIRRPESKVVDPFGDATGLANMHPGYLSTEIIGPSGPVDPGLSVISVQTRDGQPLAVLANYSQHYFGAGPVSADYYGLFCKHVARLLGQPGDGNGPFVCAMSQGTSGDLMWMDYGSPKKTINADSYAEAVAKYAEQALKQIRYHDSVPLGIVEKKLALSYRLPDEKRLEWARPIAARVENNLPKSKQEVYALEALILHERQNTELKLQAIRIGDLSISTLPNEVYALTGLKLKAQSPFASHFNIELANGAEGYIPTPEQHVLGGYTTWPARTAGLEVQAEPKIVATLLDALEEVTGQKRRAMQDEHGPYAKAILDAKPAAYWRLNESAGQAAANAVPGGAAAKVSDGAAWYLPGVGSGTGTGTRARLTPSAFSGPRQINRALHLAGGDIQADLPNLGQHYSIAAWFWLGEASGASERSGTIISGPSGETLSSRQFKDHRVEVILGDTASKSDLRADDWHLAVLVRDGEEIRVHLDGQEKPEIVNAAAPAKSAPLTFGRGLQGKLDEIAAFPRALSPTEITAFWKASGIAEERARETTERERATKEAAERSQPPKFAAGYNEAIANLKPIVHLPLDTAPTGVKTEASVQVTPATFATFNSGRLSGRSDKIGPAFSISLWFCNESPNTASPVSAYLFSRGPNGDKQAPGDQLGIGGTYRPDLTGRLFVYNGNVRNELAAGQTVIPPGTWNHAVFIRDGRRVRAYLNGVEKPEFDSEIDTTAPGIQEFFLGARSDRFAPLRGHLAQFALFDRALTAAEARQLHTASGQPAGTPTTTAAPAAKLFVQQPLSPEESLKKVHLPAGFKAELMANEPMVIDPVAFDWDAHGRLWVVEMSDYPLGMDGNGKPGGRIRVLEDTNGDGRYDKSTLFADGLNFPNGILTWREGAIVSAAPNVLFLQDTDGDGKADKQEILISGLQEGNQQLRANGLRWGLDNWVYMAIGGHHGKYGTDTRLKSLRSGQEILVGARDFRFRPDTGELEPQSGPTQFGRTRDNWGRWFGTQNAHPLWHYVLPEQYLQRNPHFGVGETRVQLLTPPNAPPVFPASEEMKRYHDFGSIGHYTSACSGMFYRDQVLFGAGRLDAFVCEPVHNLVQHLAVSEDGVTFSAKQVFGEGKFDFFASEDRWCRPVMVREGPDGALWIADMYRFMIEHPQWLPKEGKDELLPHYRLGDDKGRIYRVSRTEMPAFKPAHFDSLSTAELVSALDTANGWRRDKAHQVLLWRADTAAVPALKTMADKGSNPLARLHALCVLDGLHALEPATVARALCDTEPGVRENALRLAESRFTPEVLATAIRLVEDKDPKVQMQLAFSLGATKDNAAGEALRRLLATHADDPMMVAAVMSSATPHIRSLAGAVEGKPQSSLSDTLLATALGVNDREAVASLLAPIFTAQGTRYTPDQLAAFGRLQDRLTQSGDSLEKLRSPNDALSRLLGKSDVILAQARQTATDANAPALERIAAAALVGREPSARSDALTQLTAWLDPKHPGETQAAAIRALTAIASPEVLSAFAKAWPAMSPATRQATLTAWMSREPWAFDLVQRIERKELPASSIDTTQRARLLKHDSKRISQLAGKVFATSASARSKVLENYQPALALKGNPANGHQIYATVCAACHKRGDEGRDIGPDLLSVIEHTPEKILGNILDPSADIQPGFSSYTCTLNTGEQIYGLLASENANSVVMKLVDGTSRTVLRNQIQTLQSQNLSLMPEGLEAAITPQQMADLIAFLRSPAPAAK